MTRALAVSVVLVLGLSGPARAGTDVDAQVAPARAAVVQPDRPTRESRGTANATETSHRTRAFGRFRLLNDDGPR